MARAGLTAERLTSAAAELADEVGFDNVTVSALARRFGVKDASLYSHLRNARDLRVRVAGLALAELADRVSAAMAGRAGREALAAFADAYRDYAREHPGRYAAMRVDLDPSAGGAARENLEQPGEAPKPDGKGRAGDATTTAGAERAHSAERAERAAVEAARRHSDLTRAILRGYRLPEPDQTDAVRLLHSALHGYVNLEASGGFDHHPRPVGVSWSRAIDALDALLRNWPSAGSTGP
ncbi:TetR/AcrR family transcriptional regulator [Saccharothrix australiensis]|uniref:TetR family transcriptional regulator n=1 Tax=Saccharothrix australiensis TaxID=2072 RepID=A0A495W1D6_9PSEU|nr:TetR/AcrR family transcriptional regulator [Saccharothrix australiensis]RKT55501.1 TetR family transcriptional regulator [Saccharothrix australiensis]